MFKKTMVSIALACVLSPSAFVYADDVVHQGIDEEIETLVVIGKTPRKVQDVVGAVSVISSEVIDQQLAHDLSDILRYEVGVNVVGSGNRFGQSDIAIRGISGNRIVTEIDGIPVADQFDVGYYGNSGRNYIDPDLIKQVEILRGPASSVYGSDAIGGVVSYITKKPVDLLSQTDNPFYVGLKTGYYSIDDSTALSLNTAFAHGSSSALISASIRKGHEFDSNSDSSILSDQQDNQSKSFLAKYYFEISDNQEISLSYDYFNRVAETDLQSVLGLDRFINTTSFYGDDDTTRESLTVNYEFVLNSAFLEGGVVRAYQQKTETEQLTDENRKAYTDRRGSSIPARAYDRDFYYQQDVKGLRLNLYTNIETGNVSQHIGYGIEYSTSEIKELRNGLQTDVDTGDSTNVILSEEFPLRDFPISEVEEFGLYLNDEIAIEGTNLTIIPAIRYDRYELTPKIDSIYENGSNAGTVVAINEDSYSPKLGLVYQLNNTSKIYGQYAKGFRAPPFEDANLTLDIPMFRMRAISNPDLKSETTDGYEIGYNYEGEQHKVDLVAFYNDYKDFIQTKVNLGFDPSVGRIIFQSQNLNNAVIYGAEISYQGIYKDILAANGTIKTIAHASWSKGENKENDQGLNSMAPNSALLGVEWLSAPENISIALYANMTAAKSDLDDPNDNLATTAGYTTFDLIANYYISDKLTLAAAVNNLTNKQYWYWNDVNGLEESDPLLATLAAPGVNASLQLKYAW